MRAKKKNKYREPVRTEAADGQVYEVFTAEQQMLQEIKDTEGKVVASIRAGLNGDHEPARVTNASKVLEALEDPNTPESLRTRLDALREEAMAALLFVSQHGKVAAARAQANAIWLKAARNVGRLDWPPNEQDPVWAERFNNVCAYLRPEDGDLPSHVRT